MEYTLVRTRRKTVSLYVRADGTVEVRAPLRFPRAEIDRVVAAKSDWLIKKSVVMALQAQKRAAFAPDYGKTLLYRGQEWPVAAREGRKSGFNSAADCFYLPPGLSAPQIKAVCVQIYRELAREHLPSRTAFYAARMGVRPAAVRITGARARWGSCSGKGSVSYAWRLMMAGDDLIDYVVIHELAHLRELNHSPRFWAVVEGVLPDWADRRRRLHALQERLRGEDWD